MKPPRARKQRQAPSLNIVVQQRRIAEALARGACQKALELAQTLHQQAPNAENRQWVLRATVGRAAELRAAGKNAPALAVLREARPGAADSADLLARCTKEFFLLGAWQDAMPLVASIDDLTLQSHLQALHLDAAILHGDDGLASLPEAQRQEAQSVRQALALLDQQEDTGAQAALGSISATSPAHDWKLLVQGLAAFYANDDAALGYWQSLTPERLPASLAAPFRAQLDPAFVATQPPPVQTELLAFGQRFYTAPWLQALEDTAQLLAQEALPAALRRATEAARSIPPAQQDIRQRLARALYWAVAQQGRERDIPAYRKAFGALPEDPGGHRLRALLYEQAEDFMTAQEAWGKYEAGMQRHGMGSEADTALARALVWVHMGELAERVTPPMPADMRLPLFPGFEDEAEECEISALECYRRSVALAPAYLASHEHLLAVARKTRQQDEMVAAAQGLLEHHPEHQEALEVLADHAFRQDRWDDAVAYQERAVQGRPHDTRLTQQLSFYALGLARLRAQQGQFEAARAILTAESARDTTRERFHLLCRQAAVEIKAGETQLGEALFAQACEMVPHRLPVVFQMLIEAIRMPLESKRITQLDREFRRILKEAPVAASALSMLSLLKTYAAIGITYASLSAHQKLIVQYAKRLLPVPMSEAELQEMCHDLEVVSSNKLLLDFATRGSREFPSNPRFPYAAAQYYFALGPQRCPMTKLHTALDRALWLAQNNPAYADLARDIEAMQQTISALTLFGELHHHMQNFRMDMDEESPLDLMAAMADLFGMAGPQDIFDDDDDDWEEPPWAAPQRGTRRQRRKR